MTRVNPGPVLPPTEDVLAAVPLRPGNIHFAKEPAVVVTVPGSCISVTMHCARLEIGAICHVPFTAGIPAEDRESFPPDMDSGRRAGPEGRP